MASFLKQIFAGFCLVSLAVMFFSGISLDYGKNNTVNHRKQLRYQLLLSTDVENTSIQTLRRDVHNNVRTMSPMVFHQTNQVQNISVNSTNFVPNNFDLLTHVSNWKAGEWNLTEWNSYKKLPRALTLSQYEDSMNLLDALVNLFRSHNIEFIMCDGTLLGSYFFHDMIPWDDDIDLMVAYKDRDKFVDIFRNKTLRQFYDVMSYQEFDYYSLDFLNGVNVKETIHVRTVETKYKIDKKNKKKRRTNAYQYKPEKDRDYKLKFFRTSSMHAGKFKWRFPFVDIKFYEEYSNNKLIRKMDNTHKQTYPFFIEDFYPLHDRPFGRLSLPAPKDTQLYLKKKFKSKFICKSHIWDHVKERINRVHSANCDQVRKFYPYVERTKVKEHNSLTTETMYHQYRPLQTVIIQEKFKGNREPYTY